MRIARRKVAREPALLLLRAILARRGFTVPNRIIREGLLDSGRYWSVPLEAQRLFFHLMLLADDFGLVSLAPVFIRRRCFDDAPPQSKIDKLTELLQDADLIRVYAIGERLPSRYAFIPRYGQTLRIMKPKYPMPPDALYQDDEHARKLFSDNKAKFQNLHSTCTADALQVQSEEKRRETNTNPKRAEAQQPQRSRGSRLPPDWQPSESLKAWGQQTRPDLDLAATVENFRDYWHAQPGAGGVKLDWDRTFKRWVRNERGGGAQGKPARNLDALIAERK